MKSRRSALLTIVLFAATLPLFGSVAVKPAAGPRTFDITIDAEPLSRIVAALQPRVTRPIAMRISRNPIISYRAAGVPAESALRAIVTRARLELRENGEELEIIDPREPVVTLDVKDAEARVILKSMQRQCGIKNLVLDPDVQGSGTFLFHRVPCRQAFSVVLRSLGLAMSDYSGSLVSVEPRR
jgi:hypothetical protein